MSYVSNTGAQQEPQSKGRFAGSAEMTLLEHLIEIRSRLIRSIVAILLIFLCLYPFDNRIYGWISQPLRAYLPSGTTMIAMQVTSPFFAPLKLTMMLAFFIAIPYLLYQLWSFIAPGLYRHEKKVAVPMLFSSVLLFYLGMTFAYFVVFPIVFGFFTAAAPDGVKVTTDISAYLDFVLKMFFAFGVAFEIPVATVLLVLVGLTDVKSLSAKRPYIVVGCFVVGMLLTPPDVFSQSLLAIPMWLLFEIGVFFSRLTEKRVRRAAPADDDGSPASSPSMDDGA